MTHPYDSTSAACKTAADTAQAKHRSADTPFNDAAKIMLVAVAAFSFIAVAACAVIKAWF